MMIVTVSTTLWTIVLLLKMPISRTVTATVSVMHVIRRIIATLMVTVCRMPLIIAERCPILVKKT